MSDQGDQLDPANKGAPVASSGAVQEGSFPLIALFQLATFLAAMVACIDGGKLGEALGRSRDAAELAINVAIAAAGCLPMAFIGFVVGLGQLRMWRSAVVGGAIGALYGLMIMALYVAPAPIERGAAAAAMLVLTTIAFRVRSA